MNHIRPVLSTTFALALLLGAMFGVQNVSAVTIPVTTTADGGPDNPAPNSLRAALASAQDGDTIDATGISGTIVLAPGSTLSAELVIAKSVSILGPGPTVLTVDANLLSRVFHVTPGHIVSISGLTITNGLAAGVSPDGDGGGLYNEQSVVSLNNCRVVGNSALGDPYYDDGAGAGIFNEGLISGTATLTLVNSVIADNSAADVGGGIFNSARGVGSSASVIVEHSTISGNVADLSAGMENVGLSGDATIKIIDSTVSGNTAKFYGGAISNSSSAGSAIIDLVNSTISGNSVLNQFADGAALANNGVNGTFRISSCTFSGNTVSDPVDGDGGAIFNGGGTVAIGNTILKAGSLGGTIYNTGGTIISRGFNLSSDDGGGFLTAAGDQINTDPKLGPLADNGGATFTHLPLAGSRAIDQGNRDVIPALTSNTDQRDFARTVDDPTIANAVLGDGTDIGAVEVGAVVPPPVQVADLLVSLGVDKTSVKQGDQLTYTITVKNFGPDTATNVMINDLLSSGTTFVSAKANKGSFTAPPLNQTGIVTWTLGNLTNGGAEGAQLVVKVIIKGKTTITNTASASTDASDPNLANNSASLTTSVASGSGSGGKK